uniref:Uncharacterized protein n=1 Tax=Cucumis melo TaxID=3656 RepID=A0A9I9DIX4_CUCME
MDGTEMVDDQRIEEDRISSSTTHGCQTLQIETDLANGSTGATTKQRYPAARLCMRRIAGGGAWRLHDGGGSLQRRTSIGEKWLLMAAANLVFRV